MRIKFCLVALCFLPSTLAWADIRDVRGPEDVIAFNVWLLLVLCVFFFAGAGVFIYWKSQQQKQPQEKIIVKSAWELAYERLEELNRRNLIQNEQYKEYFSGLSDILRHYIEDRFDIRAPEMTTEEFLMKAGKSEHLGRDQKEKLKDFLNQCDMVKFAKYTPDMKEAKEGSRLLVGFIDETRGQESELNNQESTRDF